MCSRRAFQAGGVKAIPFKGPVLAQQLYDDFTLRQYIDLDILILRQEAEQALSILSRQGFVPEDRACLREGARKAYLKTVFWIGLIKPGTGIKIDLHLDLGGVFTRRPMGLQQMGTAGRKVVLEGEPVSVFPTESLLCYLCIHGTKHRWRTLDLLCCVAGLVQSRPDLDWDKVWNFSQTFGCRRVVLLGLFLAEKVLGLEVPEEVKGKITADKKVGELSKEICKKMFSKEEDDLVGQRSLIP